MHGVFYLLPIQVCGYFCRMGRSILLALFFNLVVSVSWSQIRLSKLVLEPNEKYQISSGDILVIDTLIMKDSSSIVLNHAKRDNFIHTKIASIGRGCAISGQGIDGAPGKPGDHGLTQSAPCRNGYPGRDAATGVRGNDAINLSLYFTTLKINGSLLVNLNGGEGGHGGKGGRGGDGGSGTRVCAAGDGGNGGSGAAGGDGGNGGAFSISCTHCPDLHLLLGEKLIVRNFGGFGGIGGDGGPGGQAGLGPVRDGRNGQHGIEGAHAAQGKKGLVTINGN
jgi:hypothetical protein